MSSSGVELLEGRQLLAGGSLPGLAEQLGAVSTVQVRDLGSVTPSAAVAGVQATASVPATNSVTFQFSIQLGGEYRLLVRHTGNDLSLVAATPAGTATLDAGPSGPFHQILLDLAPGNYQVTVTAAGSQPVFVDWELVLYNGVGQTASLVIAFGSNSSNAANSGPLPAGDPGTDLQTNGQVASPSATTAEPGLYLTLESNPVGNPLSAGQSSAVANGSALLVMDAPPDTTPILLTRNQPETPSARPIPPRLDASVMAKSNITSKTSSSVEMDQQSLRAVAWVNGLVTSMNLESVIGQTTADDTLATVVAGDVARRPADLEVSSGYATQTKTMDRPDLAPVVAVGMAVVALKYGRSIPRRSRTLPSVFRILPARTPSRVDLNSHAHEPWYVRLSQWSTPQSICAQFGRSGNSECAATGPWDVESLF